MGIKVKDLAAKLNLSSATVSLVLNRKPGVSESTRQRIYEALEEMGQIEVLNELQAEKDKIQFIVFRKKSSAAADTKYFHQIFSDVIEGIDAQAKAQDFNLMINYINEENIKDQIGELTDHPCDGLLLLATDMEPAHLHMFQKARIPMVVLDNYFEDEACNCVCIHNGQGVYLAVSHLKSMGHERVGYIHSLADVHNFEERYYGFINAMEKCGLPVDPRYMIQADSNNERLQEQLQQYFSNCSILPTALFTDNDVVAIHAIKALNSLNIRVPYDVSVVGFDNMPLSELLDPPLTTVDVNKRCMGKVAVGALYDLMRGDIDDGCVKIEINTRLVQRSSVRDIRFLHEKSLSD